MKTMALTDVIRSRLYHLRAASVSARERPQSSALIISIRFQPPVRSKIFLFKGVRLHDSLQQAGRKLLTQDSDVGHDAVTTDHAGEILDWRKELYLFVEGYNFIVGSSYLATISFYFLSPRNHHPEICSLGY